EQPVGGGRASVPRRWVPQEDDELAGWHRHPPGGLGTEVRSAGAIQRRRAPSLGRRSEELLATTDLLRQRRAAARARFGRGGRSVRTQAPRGGRLRVRDR